MKDDAEAHANVLKIAKRYHPRLATSVRKRGKLGHANPHLGNLDRFLASTVVGQQLSTKAAQTIWNRVEELCEEVDQPLLEVLEPRYETQLRQCGISKNKVHALIGMSEAYSQGILCEHQLLNSDYGSIHEMITSLKGFGTWSADMVAMFFTQLPDVWPESDAALRRGLRFLAPGEDPCRAASHYKPYRTYLARHVWLAVDAGLPID